MAMKECKVCGNKHETSAEARKCWTQAGKTVAQHERPASSKQMDYIETLIETHAERDLSDEVSGIVSYFYTRYPEPTTGQASNLIEVLSNLRWLVPQPAEEQEEQESVVFTEAEKLKASESTAPDTTEGLCPRCGAAGDEPCMTKNKTEASVPHVGRYTAAS